MRPAGGVSWRGGRRRALPRSLARCSFSRSLTHSSLLYYYYYRRRERAIHYREVTSSLSLSRGCTRRSSLRPFFLFLSVLEYSSSSISLSPFILSLSVFPSANFGSRGFRSPPRLFHIHLEHHGGGCCLYIAELSRAPTPIVLLLLLLLRGIVV